MPAGGQDDREAGLRHLPGLFLIEIDREGEAIGPVGPDEKIHVNDRLVFTGVVGTIIDLEKIPGLVPAADARYEVSPVETAGPPALRGGHQPQLAAGRPERVREADFRALYDAAIVAVHRNGARLTNKVGDIELHAGDTLLLQIGPDFTPGLSQQP